MARLRRSIPDEVNPSGDAILAHGTEATGQALQFSAYDILYILEGSWNEIQTSP